MCGHPAEPRDQPQQTDGAEYDEEHAPSDRRQQRAADECAERRTELRGGVQERVSDAAMLGRDGACEDPGVAGIRNGLARAHQQARRKQRRNAGENAGEDRGRRPDEQPAGEHQPDGITVGEPTRDAGELEQSVCPEERGEERP